MENLSVDRFHSLDASTGFIQSAVEYDDAFDAESKTRFLEYYKNNGLRLNSTCKAIGVKRDTVKKHIKLDPMFKAAVDELHDDWLQELEAVSKKSALEPKNTIERIFHMKCHLPDVYGQELKQNFQPITINVNGNLLIDSKTRSEVLEAQIVQEAESRRIELEAENKVSTPSTENRHVEHQ